MLDKTTLAAQPPGMDDVETMQRLNCGIHYEKFNDCMAENNRNWAKCRDEVVDLFIYAVQSLIL